MSGITVHPASQITATIRQYLADAEDFPGCVEVELGEYLVQQAPGIVVWLEEYARLRRGNTDVAGGGDATRDEEEPCNEPR
jgi:hypothetical protein